MMKRSFFGITLGNKQRFSYEQEEGLICYTFTTIALRNEGEIKLYGLSGKNKTLLATLNRKINQQKCKFALDENYFTHIYCLGTENCQIDVVGYKLERVQKQEEQKQQKTSYINLPFPDEFRALQPVEERELDSDEIELLSKKEKKEYKKKQKLKQQLQN